TGTELRSPEPTGTELRSPEPTGTDPRSPEPTGTEPRSPEPTGTELRSTRARVLVLLRRGGGPPCRSRAFVGVLAGLSGSSSSVQGARTRGSPYSPGHVERPCPRGCRTVLRVRATG